MGAIGFEWRAARAALELMELDGQKVTFNSLRHFSNSVAIDEGANPLDIANPRESEGPQTECLRAKSGGDVRIRTADPLHAKQVLYQLSYTPTGPAGEPVDRRRYDFERLSPSA